MNFNSGETCAINIRRKIFLDAVVSQIAREFSEDGIPVLLIFCEHEEEAGDHYAEDASDKRPKSGNDADDY